MDLYTYSQHLASLKDITENILAIITDHENGQITQSEAEDLIQSLAWWRRIVNSSCEDCESPGD